jgi:hypothetical protein
MECHAPLWAVVANELADLAGVTVELVTGFPNVLFGEIQAPEAMAQNLDGVRAGLSSRRCHAIAARQPAPGGGARGGLLMHPQKIMVVGAHADDIEIETGGTLLKYRQAGYWAFGDWRPEQAAELDRAVAGFVESP